MGMVDRCQLAVFLVQAWLIPRTPNVVRGHVVMWLCCLLHHKYMMWGCVHVADCVLTYAGASWVCEHIMVALDNPFGCRMLLFDNHFNCWL